MSVSSGRRIRIARVALGLTQRQLAERCGVGRWLISVLERGEHPMTHDLMLTIGGVLSSATGQRINDFFPSFVAKDTDNLRPERALSQLVGNERTNDGR